MPPDAAAPAPVPLPASHPVVRRPSRDLAAVFFTALALLTAFSWVRDLWDADEGRYAAVALDMQRAGDYVTPHEAGMRFVDKPPLLYWMECGAFLALGPSPFSARLPCMAAGAALSALTFLLAMRWGADRRAAWLAAMAAATSLVGMAFSRTVTTDMPLAACIVGALLSGFAALSSDRVAPRLALGLCIGLGLLAKGPLVAVVPAVVAASWIVVGVEWRRVVKAVLSPTAWAVAIAVAAPWYALMERANPGYLRHFVVYEHFRRFTESGYKEFHPIWMYVPLVPLGLVPWTHLLFRARLPRPLDIGRKAPVPAGRLAWAWFVSVLLFYSAGQTRLVTYILPAFPPLFVLIGARLSALLAAGDASVRRLSWWAFAIGAVVALAGGAIAMDLLDLRKGVADGRIQSIGIPVVCAAAGLLAVPLFLRAVRRPAARAAVLVLAAAGLWWGVDLAAAHVDSMRSSRALAETLTIHAAPGDTIVSLDRYPQGLRFFADLDVKIAENPVHPERSLHTQREIVEPWASKDGAGRLLTMAELRALWSGSGRVLLIARDIDQAKEFPNAFRLATGLSGAQRSDLVVAENRARPRSPRDKP